MILHINTVFARHNIFLRLEISILSISNFCFGIEARSRFGEENEILGENSCHNELCGCLAVLPFNHRMPAGEIRAASSVDSHDTRKTDSQLAGSRRMPVELVEPYSCHHRYTEG
jgi:hypothetical protein